MRPTLVGHAGHALLALRASYSIFGCVTGRFLAPAVFFVFACQGGLVWTASWHLHENRSAVFCRLDEFSSEKIGKLLEYIPTRTTALLTPFTCNCNISVTLEMSLPLVCPLQHSDDTLFVAYLSPSLQATPRMRRLVPRPFSFFSTAPL